MLKVIEWIKANRKQTETSILSAWFFVGLVTFAFLTTHSSGYARELRASAIVALR